MILDILEYSIKALLIFYNKLENCAVISILEPYCTAAIQLTNRIDDDLYQSR